MSSTTLRPLAVLHCALHLHCVCVDIRDADLGKRLARADYETTLCTTNYYLLNNINNLIPAIVVTPSFVFVFLVSDYPTKRIVNIRYCKMALVSTLSAQARKRGRSSFTFIRRNYFHVIFHHNICQTNALYRLWCIKSAVCERWTVQCVCVCQTCGQTLESFRSFDSTSRRVFQGMSSSGHILPYKRYF